MCLSLFLLITIIHALIVSVFSVDFQCTENAKVTDPPLLFIPSSVILDSQASDKNPDLYVVSKGTKSFIINCTSSLPVDWTFQGSIGNTVVNSKRTFSFRNFEDGKLTQACYYSALEFTSVKDEITGEYTCITASPNLYRDNYEQSSNGRKTFKLFSGLSALTVRNKTLTYNNWLEESFSREKYEIPCAANHPHAQLQLLYKDLKTKEWTRESNVEAESLGVSITVSVPQNRLPCQYKCVGYLNDSLTEVLHIDIPSYPDYLFFPESSEVVYKIPMGNQQIFKCFSKFPITVVRTDNNSLSELSISALISHKKLDFQEMGYMYQMEATLKFPDLRGRNVDLSGGQVICIEEKSKKHVKHWNYTLIDEKVHVNSQILGNLYITFTTTPESTTMNYIKANSDVELLMRAKCLNLTHQNWGLCNNRFPSLPTFAYSNASAFFRIPDNMSGVYQWRFPSSDIRNEQFVPMVDGHYDNGNKPIDKFLEIRIFNVHAEVGTPVKVKCVSSNFMFYGSTFWVFIWKNGSRTSVYETSILNDTIEKHGALTIRQSEILVHSSELERLACYGISPTYQLLFLMSAELKITTKFPHSDNTIAVTVTAILASISLIILIIISTVLWNKWRNYIRKDLAFQQCVNNFFEGYKLNEQDGNDSCAEAESQPYNMLYEIAMDSLQIEWNSPLGSGAFGVVLKGIMCKGKFSTLTTVAVKTIKNNFNTEDIATLLSELKLMIYIGKHPHVVNLLGACTENLYKRKIYVILEFCKHGSIYQYLVTNRSNFVKDSTCPSNEVYKKMIDCKFSQYELTIADLLRWTSHVMFGMEYLASKKIIHGDLACRNVLLDDLLHAKISDFGLSRRLHDCSEYVKQSDDPLPWRWMAPESLKDMKFSEESDVWSFGVTLWEIFSLAETPYGGLNYTTDFVVSLENNFRLGKPEHSTEELYTNIIVRCWEQNASERPTFKQLVEDFQSSMTLNNRKSCDYLDPIAIEHEHSNNYTELQEIL